MLQPPTSPSQTSASFHVSFSSPTNRFFSVLFQNGATDFHCAANPSAMDGYPLRSTVI
jgi:G:T/U-mismatch repair DNA glycosylase